MDSLASGVGAAGGVCVGAAATGPQKPVRALNYLFEPIGHHMTTSTQLEILQLNDIPVYHIRVP